MAKKTENKKGFISTYCLLSNEIITYIMDSLFSGSVTLKNHFTCPLGNKFLDITFGDVLMECQQEQDKFIQFILVHDEKEIH